MRAKVLLLLAVCMAIVVGAELPGSSVESARTGASIKRTTASELGVSFAHPKTWRVERERYTYDGTSGFTLWKTGTGAVEDHGGTPAARVALAVDLDRGDIERRVRQRMSEIDGFEMTRSRVTVGEGKLKGVAVGPIPGSTPSTEVYVAVEDRVYQINVYGEKLDERGRDLLGSLKFDAPSRSRSALGEKPNAGDPRTFYDRDPETAELTEREQAKRAEASSGGPTRSASLTNSQVPTYSEKRIYEGCWLAASKFWVQTQHGYEANGFADDPGTNAPRGQSILGIPNYWGQYTHGDLGYGRCASTYYTNDKFAIDYPLNRGDVVFSPFSGGTVTFAGRNTSHANYGLFVVIRDDNGKYVSMSAHLNGLAPGIRRGARVTDATVIGYAGNTGDPSIPVGEVHLHQAFYRYPAYLADGSPYGGRGLQVLFHHYVGTAIKSSPGVYKYGWSRTSTQLAEGSRISN